MIKLVGVAFYPFSERTERSNGPVLLVKVAISTDHTPAALLFKDYKTPLVELGNGEERVIAREILPKIPDHFLKCIIPDDCGCRGQDFYTFD